MPARMRPTRLWSAVTSCMSSPWPNQPASGNGALASLFHARRHWRAVPEPGRWAAPGTMRFLLLSIAVIGLTSCRTPIADDAGPDIDLRKGPERCELHSVEMRTTRVPTAIGCALPYSGYLEARDKFFPHSLPRVLESKRRYCFIYVCDECIAAERQWSQAHEPQPNEALQRTPR